MSSSGVQPASSWFLSFVFRPFTLTVIYQIVYRYQKVIGVFMIYPTFNQRWLVIEEKYTFIIIEVII